MAGPGRGTATGTLPWRARQSDSEKQSKEIKPVAIMQPHTVLMGCVMGFESRLIFIFENQRLRSLSGGEGVRKDRASRHIATSLKAPIHAGFPMNC